LRGRIHWFLVAPKHRAKLYEVLVDYILQEGHGLRLTAEQRHHLLSDARKADPTSQSLHRRYANTE
jgi:hypothetical protein